VVLALAGGVTDAEASDDALAALRRGLVLVEAYESARWHENRRVVREVRPLWRDADMNARRARDELIETLGRLTPAMPALSDPGVLESIGAFRASLDDGRRLCIISAWLAGDSQPALAGAAIWREPDSGPRGGPEREPVTLKDDRTRRQAALTLLALGQKLRDPSSREEALGKIRSLGDALGEWMPVHGEEGLRAAASSPGSANAAAWRDFTGGAAADVVRALNDTREAWLVTWAGVKSTPRRKEVPAVPQGDVGSINALRQLVETSADGVQAAGLDAALDWPGLELSPAAIEALLARIKGDLSRAAGVIISQGAGGGAAPALDKAVSTTTDAARLCGLLADLERGARHHGVVPRGCLDELAFPPPFLPTLGEDLTPGVWLIRERESLALICRCLEEYADAMKTQDHARAEPMWDRAVEECGRVQSVVSGFVPR
jgi:hypothetical protein